MHVYKVICVRFILMSKWSSKSLSNFWAQVWWCKTIAWKAILTCIGSALDLDVENRLQTIYPGPMGGHSEVPIAGCSEVSIKIAISGVRLAITIRIQLSQILGQMSFWNPIYKPDRCTRSDEVFQVFNLGPCVLLISSKNMISEAAARWIDDPLYYAWSIYSSVQMKLINRLGPVLKPKRSKR